MKLEVFSSRDSCNCVANQQIRQSLRQIPCWLPFSCTRDEFPVKASIRPHVGEPKRPARSNRCANDSGYACKSRAYVDGQSAQEPSTYGNCPIPCCLACARHVPEFDHRSDRAQACHLSRQGERGPSLPCLFGAPNQRPVARRKWQCPRTLRTIPQSGRRL